MNIRTPKRSLFALVLALAMASMLVACGAPKDTGGGGNASKSIQLGDSPFTLTIPASFKEGDMSAEDVADDQVAYYYSDESLLDFDVYQFSKEGYPEALEDFIQEEAAEYDAVEIVTDADINGIPVACYRATEESDGVAYETITYAVDNGEQYVEIVFWLDGDDAASEAAAIIATLAQN